MPRTDKLTQGHLLAEARSDYSAGNWREAREKFRTAQAQDRLSADDLLALGDSAWWLGLNDEALIAFEEGFQLLIEINAAPQGAKLALGLGFLWMLRGEFTIGSGWISRGQQLLADLPECVEQGYGKAIEVESARASGRIRDSIALSQEVQAIGARFHDPTLTAIGLFGEGVGRLRGDDVARGISLLDQAMIPVAAGVVDRDWAGNLYCQMMGICSELADFERARHWTEATERWCNRFTSAVMFWGICRLHRSQLLELDGDWAGAETEAQHVIKNLADMNIGAVAESHYQLGEILRLRGEHARAEAAYRVARELGRDPQPGLALLLLAQGRMDSAAAGISACLAAAQDDLARFRLRKSQIEICLAREDLSGAAEALDELDRIAATFPSTGLQAAAGHSRGAVMLAEGRYGDALVQLRQALREWQHLRAPYQVARVRELVAEAYGGLGDDDSAEAELSLAHDAFLGLGASDDAKRTGSNRAHQTLPRGMTSREAEVLSCVAGGQSNREIAATLLISEKTVARHLSNIFSKLDVGSRTEAAAFAFEHGLVAHRRA